MAEVFISYAREDQDFVRRLKDALDQRGRESWVDWKDIVPSDKWRKSIEEAIDAADMIVFVISPDSIASEPCLDELQRASQDNKRVIGLVHRDVEGLVVPPQIEEINWIFMRDQDDFAQALTKLLQALDLDLDLVRVHTRVLTRARAWELAGRRPTPLLRGEELRGAEAWLARAAAGAEPKPTPLQAEFVAESRRRSTRRLGIALVGAATIAIVAVALATFALIQRAAAKHQARVAQSRQLAAQAEADLQSAPETAVALAARALRLEQTPEALHAMWHALQASRLRFLLQQPSPVQALAFSPDGRELVAGGADGGVRAWSLAGRRALWSVGRGGSGVTGLTVARTGDVVVVARATPSLSACSVEVRGVSSGALQRTLASNASGGCPFMVGLVGATRTVAIGTGAGRVDFLNLDTGQHLGALTGLVPPGALVMVDMKVSPDGQTLAVVDEHLVRVVRIRDGRVLGEIRAPNQAFLFNPGSVSFGPRDTRVLIGGEYDTEIDDVATGFRSFLESSQGSGGVAWSPNGRLEAAFTFNRAAVWSSTGRLVETLSGRTSQGFQAIAFSPQGVLAGGAGDGAISIWDADPDLPGRATSAAVADSSFVSLDNAAGPTRSGATAVGGTSFDLGNGNTGGYVYVTTPRGAVTARLHLTGDGPFAVTGSGELAYPDAGVLKVAQLQSGATIRSLTLPRHDPAKAVAASFDGTTIAVVTQPQSGGGELSVVSAGRVMSKRIAFGAGLNAELSLSPDGRLLAVTTMSGPNQVSMLRTSDLQVVRTYGGTAASFGPSGVLAIERPDLTIAVTAAGGLNLRTVLGGVPYGGVQMAFSPDGRLLATLDEAQVLRVWDAVDGTLLTTRYLAEAVKIGQLATPQLAMTGGGLAIVGVDSANSIEAFDVCSICLDPTAMLAAAHARLAQISPIAAQ